jgi:hypothetical protein
MVDILKSETSVKDSPTNPSNQPNSSKSNFQYNSDYPNVKEKVEVKITKPVGIVTRYINAMNAYDTLCSDENYEYLEKIYKEYKDFLESNQ